MRWWLYSASWLGSVLLPACPVELEHSCTEIGCGDGVTVSVRTADGTWAEGNYEVTFGTDDTRFTCPLRVPDDLPAQLGSLQELPCTPALGAHLDPETVCTEQRSAGAVSQSCTPVSGHFILQAHFEGTPASLAVLVERDGTVLLDDMQTLRYTAERPNGPDCEPVCRQSNLELTLP